MGKKASKKSVKMATPKNESSYECSVSGRVGNFHGLTTLIIIYCNLCTSAPTSALDGWIPHSCHGFALGEDENRRGSAGRHDQSDDKIDGSFPHPVGRKNP